MKKKNCFGKSKWQILKIKGSFLILLMCIWQMIANVRIYPKALFPGVDDIAIRFISLIRHDHLLSKAFFSMSFVIITMMISLILSLFLVGGCAKYRYVRINTEMMNTILSPIPGVALVPVVILWLGLTKQAMLFIMIHAMIWPLVTHNMLAVDRINQRYGRMMQTFKIPWFRRMKDIYLHGILPDLIVGLEIAWSRGWRALLSIEMIFGIIDKFSGLGWLIYERRMYMDTAGMFAGLITIAICGILIESVIFKSSKLEAYIENHY